MPVCAAIIMPKAMPAHFSELSGEMSVGAVKRSVNSEQGKVEASRVAVSNAVILPFLVSIFSVFTRHCLSIVTGCRSFAHSS